MRTETEAKRAITLYADTIYRVCFIHLKNRIDVEDIFQNVFLKYIQSEKIFESDDHEKAWLLRVAINSCKDLHKNFFRRNVDSIENIDVESLKIEDENKEVLETVLSLPEKYRNVIYLFYYEGYSAVEIAKIMNKNENTIYTWLSRAKQLLRNILEVS